MKNKKSELERTVNNLNDYIEYLLIELEVETMSELYKTPEERISVLENIEQQFNDKYKPAIKRGHKLYF